MRDEIDAAQNELHETASVTRVTQHAVELVAGINTAVFQIDTISSTYLQPLKTFKTVVSAIIEVRFLASCNGTIRPTLFHRSIPTLGWR